MTLQGQLLCIPNAQNMPKAAKYRLCTKLKTLTARLPSAKIDEKK